MGKKKYPYENLALRAIKGEKWRQISGFEGLYEISSFGRIKTLKRSYINNIGATVQIKERILKARLICRRSKTVPHNNYALTAGLCLDGQKKLVYVGRLVYNAFVEKFEMNDRGILIGFKDWDGRNIVPSNLYRTSISELMQLSYDTERYKASLSDKSKPITQFDHDGNFIAIFNSIIDAGKKTGLTSGCIAKAANGEMHIYKGYIWQFGNSKICKKRKLIKEKDGGINTKLLKKAIANVPPVANLRVGNLKGERWKDVPGFEGYYKVSNYGRIKALSRLSKGVQQRLTPEFIKKPFLKDSGKKNGTEFRQGTIGVTLSKGKMRRSYVVAHLVYSSFIAPMHVGDRIKIDYKDSDSANLYYKNLICK